jgi:hypothetical protein
VLIQGCLSLLNSGANLSILNVCPTTSHIMLNGSVCIIDDTMTVYMERFHNANSTRKCEQLIWILLHILQKLKISSPMTEGHAILFNSSWGLFILQNCKTLLIIFQWSMPEKLICTKISSNQVRVNLNRAYLSFWQLKHMKLILFDWSLINSWDIKIPNTYHPWLLR